MSWNWESSAGRVQFNLATFFLFLEFLELRVSLFAKLLWASEKTRCIVFQYEIFSILRRAFTYLGINNILLFQDDISCQFEEICEDDGTPLSITSLQSNSFKIIVNYVLLVLCFITNLVWNFTKCAFLTGNNVRMKIQSTLMKIEINEYAPVKAKVIKIYSHRTLSISTM